jgi:ankyrin repeat protein
MAEVLHEFGCKGGDMSLPVNQATKRGTTPLMVAAQAGHEQTMKLLLSMGAEPRLKDRHGNTLIHLAALAGRVHILELVLSASEAEQVPQENPAVEPEEARLLATGR